jgi:hypothetical protein
MPVLGAAFGGRQHIRIRRWPRRARDSGRGEEEGKEEGAGRRKAARGNLLVEARTGQGLSFQVRVHLFLPASMLLSLLAEEMRRGEETGMGLSCMITATMC